MNEHNQPWLRPVFFRRNRVFRVYRGGMLFHDFLNDPAEDGNEPEEWICSAVRAINPGHTDPLEGISLRQEDGMPFDRLLAEHPKEYLGERKDLGVLVKYLDSAIRLPVQVHPTREFSRRNFGSPYGKAESWLILATRPDACIYFGFRERITKEALAAVVERSEQEPEAMTQLVNRVPVKPGDIFFVNAGVIHAIGAGCLILEVQEPTDFTIQPERWCGEYRLSDNEMYLGLSREDALGCFDMAKSYPAPLTPKALESGDGVLYEAMIDGSITTSFSVRMVTLSGGSFTLGRGAAIYVALDGAGRITGDGYSRDIKKGDYFMMPAAAAGKFTASGDIKIAECFA